MKLVMKKKKKAKKSKIKKKEFFFMALESLITLSLNFFVLVFVYNSYISIKKNYDTHIILC